MVANTLFDYVDEFLATYHNLVSHPMEEVAPSKFSQLDYVLSAQQNSEMVYDCWSDRSISLRSHHFLMIASVLVEFPQQGIHYGTRRNIQSMRNKDQRKVFYSAFSNSLHKSVINTNVGLHAQQITEAFQYAAKTLPQHEVLPKRHWISEITLSLIPQKKTARRLGNYEDEVSFTKRVRQSAKVDKKRYLYEELAIGKWSAVKKLRQVLAKKLVGMQDAAGNVVELEKRPDTMVAYFEAVPWQVRFPDLVPESIAPIQNGVHVPN